MNPSTLTTRALVVQQALELLECEARESDALASPDAVRDYLRLLLADRPHEVFAVVFLDAQNRVIETLEPVDMAALQRFFVDQGVWIRPFGRLLYLMPPYIVEPEELTRLTTALVQAAAMQ